METVNRGSGAIPAGSQTGESNLQVPRTHRVQRRSDIVSTHVPRIPGPFFRKSSSRTRNRNTLREDLTLSHLRAGEVEQRVKLDDT